MIEAQRDQEKQLRLIEIDADQLSLPSSNGNSAFCDPAFASNKTLPLHRWVPWIAGFSSDFVKDALTPLKIREEKIKAASTKAQRDLTEVD
jgi:hypothetical protein